MTSDVKLTAEWCEEEATHNDSLAGYQDAWRDRTKASRFRLNAAALRIAARLLSADVEGIARVICDAEEYGLDAEQTARAVLGLLVGGLGLDSSVDESARAQTRSPVSPLSDGGLVALPCVVCRRRPSGCAVPNQPLDGLSFSSRGHYGTTVFDPMDGSALEINVCDGCLTEASEYERVLLYPADGGAAVAWSHLSSEAPPVGSPFGEDGLVWDEKPSTSGSGGGEP